MTSVRTAHTADLDAATLHGRACPALRGLPDDMTEHDWEHCLGGVHALAWEGDELVGHAAVVQRRLLHGGRALRTGYVEGVAVRADRRRRGHAGAMMEALERVVRAAYELGALGASDQARGVLRRAWLAAVAGADLGAHSDGHRAHRGRGRLGSTCCRAAPARSVAELTCDWREGDVW